MSVNLISAALFLWLLPQVHGAVVLTALSPLFFDPPVTYIPPQSLWVGHSNTGLSGPSYVQTIDFDGDGVDEIRLHGDGGTGVFTDLAPGVELLGIEPRLYGLADRGVWAWPNEKGAPFSSDLSAYPGLEGITWLSEDVDGPNVLWGALGLQIATSSPWGYAIANGNPKAYMGIRFLREDGWHYGYVRVGYRLGSIGWLMGYAWETEPDTPILAGAVPEPGTATLFILAMTGVLRRQRQSPEPT